MVLAFALLVGVNGGAPALAQTTATSTAPSVDDSPAPAVLAPTYLAVGKSLLVRIALIRRTLNDLTLDQACKAKAGQVLDGVEHDMQDLMGEIQVGRMPPARQIAAVPLELQTARAEMTKILSPEQDQLLMEKLRSVRGETRGQIAQLRQAIADLKTSDQKKHGCDAIMADADAGANKLPDCDLEGDQDAKARQSMLDLFAWTHDKLERVLTPGEQSELGSCFAQLAAKVPATQPSPGQG